MDNKSPMNKRFSKYINHIPKIIIYLICAGMFVNNVDKLIKEYQNFETIVMIEYKTPETIQFPAFTICGCCLERTIQNSSFNDILNHEMKLLQQYSVMEIIENISYPEQQLINSCMIGMNSKQNINNKCADIEPILQSVYDGRKCFTYLTSLHSHIKEKRGMIDNNDLYTAYIKVELNFPQFKKDHHFPRDDTLQNADVIFAIHPPNMLPTMLDTEFYRIDSSNMYEIQFTKEVIILKEKPYITACRKYNTVHRPKSRNECVNLCILKQSLMDNNVQCVYYHNIISAYMLDYLDKNPDIKFCTARSYVSYVNFTKLRRKCYNYCARDCQEENYKTTIDVSSIENENKQESMGTIKTSHKKAMIIIWPNREMYQEVTHRGELNLFKLIGYLGGHAHIWLGLSIIQFFDLFENVFLQIRYSLGLFNQKFYQWFHV